MAASASSLQAMLDDLHNCCGRLCPEIRPSRLQSCSLSSLAEAEGEEVLEAVQERLEAVASSSGACCTCGAAVDAQDGVGEEDVLLTRLDFASRECRLLRAGFPCDDCRQLLRPDRLVCALSSLPHDQDDGRATFLQLCAHLASVNGAPGAVLDSPDATLTWGQEALSRAYALQVLASGLSGWKLVTRDGQQVVPGEAGSALKALEACLMVKPVTPKKHSKKRKGTGASARAEAPAATAAALSGGSASPAHQQKPSKAAPKKRPATQADEAPATAQQVADDDRAAGQAASGHGRRGKVSVGAQGPHGQAASGNGSGGKVSGGAQGPHGQAASGHGSGGAQGPRGPGSATGKGKKGKRIMQ